MSFFDNLYKQLFSTPDKPVDISETLTRSDQFLADFQEWKNSPRPYELIKKLKTGYDLKKEGAESDLHLSLYNSIYANGFYFTYNSLMSKRDFLFMFDLFREIVLKMGYFLSTSDIRIREKAGNIEITEKHYLKPQNRNQEGLLEQLYGNVLIEHVSINNVPSYIKIMANIYADSNYKKALEFDEFVERLLSSD